MISKTFDLFVRISWRQMPMAMVEEVKEEATEIKLQRSSLGCGWYQCKCK